MKKTVLPIAILIFTVLFISGCLTCEKKEYSFTFTGDDSGTLTIRYINLMSTRDDSLDVSDADFQALITEYYEGNSLENDFPGAIITSKRLFEENGVLCGEVVVEFNSLSEIGLYRYKNEGPYMFCLPRDMEAYGNSNGEYGGDYMPVVFWEPDLKVLKLESNMTEPGESTSSLLDNYNAWKKN